MKRAVLAAACLLLLLLGVAQPAAAASRRPASKAVITAIKKLQRKATSLPRGERARTARVARSALSLARRGRICPLRATLLGLPYDPEELGPAVGRVDRALFKDRRLRRCGPAKLRSVKAKTITGSSVLNLGAPFDNPPKPGPANKEEDDEAAELPVGPENGKDPSAGLPADTGGDTPASASGGGLKSFPSRNTDELTSLKRALGQPTASDYDALGDPLDPVVASSGLAVVQGGNTYLSFSSDGGRTFKFIKPSSIFKDNPDGGVCCDFQVAYAKSIDAFLLLEQYWSSPDKTGTGKGNHNRYRLAWAKPSDLIAGGGVSGWNERYDIKSPTGANANWFDRPDMSVGTNYAYLSWDVWQGYDDPKDNDPKNGETKELRRAGATFARIPLKQLKPDGVANKKALTVDVVHDDSWLVPRLAQSPKSIGYAFRSLSDSELALMKWPENTKTVSSVSVKHDRIGTEGCKVGGFAQFCTGSKTGKGTMDARRLTGAAVELVDGNKPSRIWVAISTARHKAGGNKAGETDEDRPTSRLLVIRAKTSKVVSTRMLTGPGCSAGFVRLSANTNGEVAGSYVRSCADNFPNFRFALLTGTPRFDGITSSARGTTRIGDYSGIGPEPDGKHFVAAANNLTKGKGYDVTFARFGRTYDPIPPGPAPLPPSESPLPPPAVSGPKPDLVVSALTQSSITIKNQGNAASPITSATVGRVGMPASVQTTIGPLAPGASQMQTYSSFPCTTSSEYRGTADSGGVADESDETNNTLTKTCL